MDYLKSLEAAVVYIESNLHDDINVEDVARAAGYSYYHLTRQFYAILGENVGSYIKKRRLADAAKKLVYTDMRITDIALENGFDSSEAFSRAFKSAYKHSPSNYRKNRLDAFIGSKEMLEPALLRHHARNITVHPEIIELPDILAAGIRGHTTLRDNVIPQLWASFTGMLRQIPNRSKSGRAFGICEACEDNTIYTMNNNVSFSEVAAVEVDSFEGLPPLFVPKVLKAGRYAVFTHRGSLAMLTKTFGYIWGTWFLNTKETVDEKEDFELYDHRFISFDHPDSEIDIYIPIV